MYGGTFSGGELSTFGISDRYIPVGLMNDLEDVGMDLVTDPNDPDLNVIDNVQGFTPEMIFNALDTPDDIESYRDRLRLLHLNDTPTNVNDYNELFDVYDVFN